MVTTNSDNEPTKAVGDNQENRQSEERRRKFQETLTIYEEMLSGKLTFLRLRRLIEEYGGGDKEMARGVAKLNQLIEACDWYMAKALEDYLNWALNPWDPKLNQRRVYLDDATDMIFAIGQLNKTKLQDTQNPKES